MTPKDRELMPPIAVVGISCRLPGGANCPDELWQFLAKGAEAWSPVPPERFHEAAFHHPSADDPNGTTHHQGGHFIDADVRDFDASFFRISPQQAAAMDPQQRFLLEMSYEALESAGWSREHVAGSSTSVYTAMFTADYERNLYKDTLDLPIYYTTGTEKAILSNRISHYFDLHGPSVTLDTACSGGLVALHQACQSLRAGESSASLVAAANLTLGPDHHVGMSNLHLVGASGRCHPFDRRGTGYGRGEGLVVLALKRLDDALRDRDPVRAVVRGTAVNQDGYTAQGITYPNGAAQAALIRAAYARCGGGLRPQDVAYVEAHGTGTVAGDTEELNALASVFASSSSSSSSSSNTPRSLPLYVGSIKGNIGHTENTSGLASLVKATLILDHQQIPPVAGFADPKPGLPLDKMRIPTELTPLPVVAGIPSTVSINSFGFGGTNAHVILQKGSTRPPPSRWRDADDDNPSPRLFVLSAHSESSLKMMLRAHLAWLAKEPDTLSLADLSYTLCHRRSQLNWRFGCVAQDRPSLMETLQRGLEGGKGIRGGGNSSPTIRPRTADPYVIFVFTGQGAQWAGMGRELLAATTTTSTPCPIFQKSIAASNTVLKELGADWDLVDELLRDAAGTRLNMAALAQPATTAIQIALVDRLRAQGIRPRAVVGHSSGEIAAAYAAGRLSHRAAVGIAYHRGCCVASSNRLSRGAMMAVGLGERGVVPFMQNLVRGTAGIACVNSPGNVTISGDSEAVDEIAGRLASDERGVFHRRLMVDTAYHSHHMQAVAEDYLGRLDQFQADGRDDLTQDDDGIVFISSVSGRRKTDCFDSAYWTANLVSRVQFCDAIQTLVNDRVSENSGRDALFVEIGPHNALSGPVRQTLTAPGGHRLDFDYYSVLQRKVDAVSSTLSLASSLFERGVKFDMGHVTSLTQGWKTANVYTNLPAYPWDHSDKHWHESRVSRQYRTRPEPYHDLLGVRVADSTSIQPRWRHMVCLKTLPWLSHHVVDGLVVFPGSGYLCMATEAIRQVFREQQSSSSQQQLETIVLRNVSFHRALVVPSPPRRVEMQLSLEPQSAKFLEYAFRVTAWTDGRWHEHCSGFVEAHMADELESAATTRPSQTDSLKRHQSSDDGSTVLDPRALYDELADVGNTYGPSFTGIKSFSMKSDADQAKSTIQVPDIASLMPAAHQAPHIIHPATLDILLHTALPLVGRRLGRGSVMPTHIEELMLSATDAMPRDPGSGLTALTSLRSSRQRTAYADLAVTLGDIPLVAVSGIEMRSLGTALTDSKGSSDAEGICYELEWKPDPQFLSSASVETSQTPFEDVAHSIGFKNAAISILELGSGNEDLSLTFIDDALARGGRIASYELVETTSQHAVMVQEKLEPHCVPCSTLALDGVKGPNSELKPQLYDVILVSDPSMLVRSSTLIKPSGTILAHLSDGDKVYDTWCAAAQGAALSIRLKLSWQDKIQGSSIMVARPGSVGQKGSTAKYHMLSHSKGQPKVDWVESLTSRLQALCPGFTTGSIDDYSTNSDDDLNDDTCFLVVDDQIQPILSDPGCFNAVVALLNQPARIIWVSPDDPISMHQITGVARTAHAENYKLRLTTIHADAERLASQQLQDLVVDCMQIIMDPREDGEAYRDREYWMRGDGTVAIPRLRPSRDLNRVINNTGRDLPDSFSHIEQHVFTDPACPLVLSTDGDMTRASLFVQDYTLDSPLTVDEIEIKTEGFSLSKQTLTGGFYEYVGTISQVGTAVKNFAPGDRVWAVSSVLGASRVRVLQAVGGRISHDISPTCAATLFSLMAASYALRRLADLPSTATVLLLVDALSPQGRAAISVARFMGIRAIVAAIDCSQADELIEHLGVPRDNIWVRRPSLYRRSWDDLCPNGLDAILLAEDTTIPQNVLSKLKPFGCVLSIAPSGGLQGCQNAKLPSNARVYHCDIVDLMHCRPEFTATLVKQATEALPHLCMDGLNLRTLDVRRSAEAVRMVESGPQPHIIVTAQNDSKVNAIVLREDTDKDGMCVNDGGWHREDVSYVVAGGLGDLGRRLLLLMAKRGAKHLVTLSRSLPSRQDKDDLQASLEAAQPGCRLYCVACDLTSESSVQTAAATLRRDHGVPPVRGVVHSAAILQDRPLNSMTYRDFRLVSQVKVDGTLLLERAFASPSLDFFVMLSSAANIVGTGGQANYNAGNAVQDALAQARRRAGNCRYISLNIGWIEDAIHTTDNDARTSSLSRTGLRTIQSEELSRFFDYVLGASCLSGSRQPQLTQAIIGFDSASLSRSVSHSSNVNSPMFCHVRPVDSKAAPEVSPEKTTKIKPTAAAFKQVLASGDNEAAVDYITAAICGQLAKLISADVSRVDASQASMLELGLDSLVAIELRNWLMRTFDAPLQSSEIMDDPTIRALGAKVVSRSRLCNDKPLSNGINGHDEGRPDRLMKVNGANSQTNGEVNSSVTSTANQPHRLPSLPIPSLHDALRMFEESRRAIDSAEEQATTARHVQSLAEGIGPSLQQMVENEGSTPAGSVAADGYERQIYLERREPLQDYSVFTVGHPSDAPRHSQARRAAIVTVAAAEFARGLAAGQVPADTLHGMPMGEEARKWLFGATRRPGAEIDRIERHDSSRTHGVVVLRRGHVFELDLPEQDVHLQVSSVEAAFQEVMGLSEEQVPSLCSLTAGDRKSWFLARSELETDPENVKILDVIDNATFVVCLDDESPMNAGERHTQFLLGGQGRPFTNRWLDKPVQFAVTANGLSAGVFEHTKIDGLDVRTLHQHIIRALFADDHHHSGSHPAEHHSGNKKSVGSSAVVSSTPAPYRHFVSQHSWRPTSTVLQRVKEIQFQCQKSYGYIDHRYFTAKELSLDRLRASRKSAHATAHLTALLAVYLVDKEIRPAWEIISLGTWAGGRIDWVQTVSPAVRSFLEMAAAAAAATEGDSMTLDQGTARNVLRRQFDTAARGYSQTMAAAAQGHGYVRHLYALLDAFKRSQPSVSCYNDEHNEYEDGRNECKYKNVPSLFRTHAWNSTRRGGPSQGLKIGFMPDGEGTDQHAGTWDEGGFLMDGDDGVYLHCGIRGHGIKFAVSARPKYADAVCRALDRASSLVSSLLEEDVLDAS